MIDYETLREQAKWAEYKLAHPSLKSKIVEGLPKQEDDKVLYGVRYFFKDGKHFTEILYKEVENVYRS